MTAKLSAHTGALHKRVLDAWPTTSAGDIAQGEGISRNTVLGMIRCARKRGDERAVRKPDAPHRSWWKEGDPRVMAIATAGARASVEARRKAREDRI